MVRHFRKMKQLTFASLLCGSVMLLGAGCNPGKKEPPVPKVASGESAKNAAAANLGPLPKLGAAPAWQLKDLAGTTVTSEQLKGKVVVVDFWATWCGPCRQEMPHLNRIHERYHKAGFMLLGINLDEQPEAAHAMVRKLGIGFPVLFDSGKRVSRLYDVSAMPSTILIDRDGRVRHVHRGYRAGHEVQYDNEVREMLKQ